MGARVSQRETLLYCKWTPHEKLRTTQSHAAETLSIGVRDKEKRHHCARDTLEWQSVQKENLNNCSLQENRTFRRAKFSRLIETNWPGTQMLTSRVSHRITPSLTLSADRSPSCPWRSLGWITPHQPVATNTEIPAWLRYHLVPVFIKIDKWKRVCAANQLSGN